ncbi:MAG: hypothetical protein TREMPRED_003367, partial [Tremellales sp. Tagirdzhanova-0007]
MDEWEYTELDCHPMRKRISVVPVDHPLVPVWSSWFALNVMNLLTARAPGTVCLDLVRIADGRSIVATCDAFLDEYGIADVECEIRETIVVRSTALYDLAALNYHVAGVAEPLSMSLG